MKKDSIPYVVAFTFLICAAFVLVLAAANEGTKDLVAANKEFATQSAVLGAFGIPYSDASGAAAAFASSVRPGKAEGFGSWLATIDGTEYVAVEQSGAGLWGAISVVLAAS
ncbi:MAG: FMN-binding protein, partial [Spirochaetes bacterium]|nr:FMN-binding protein [Spirochaetota bacterium]